MNYEAYPFSYNPDFTHFRFQSVGKRGVIEKAIAFSSITDSVYNLALLDFDPIAQGYSDNSVSDNGDMHEILATVMMVIIDYLDRYPNRMIYLTGNSASRTRLYQIAIGKVINKIESGITVFGYCNTNWIPFELNGSFESFLIAKKELD